jgi:hypothetical protein
MRVVVAMYVVPVPLGLTNASTYSRIASQCQRAAL